MNDALLKRLEAKLDRRSFLRGSSLAAAALLGVAAASPLVAFAQTQDKSQDAKKTAEPGNKNQQPPVEHDGKKGEPSESAPPQDVSTTDTKIDADGREYRACPECGSNVYRQGRTWTCENCGYSYIE
jgi:predicted RNA-binding Zn-ribbon protein involved in translation (DUF1610 family)